MAETKQYRFEPGARSIIQMGEELVGHPTTAINELVKNGYDADATISQVYINYNKDNSQSFICISDNGLGMSHDVLFGDWLRPSVSAKRNENVKSKIFERNFLGSKGIGRLASMALGRFLTVISKTSEEEKYNWLLIDRLDFKEESLLSKIEFPGGTADSLSSILNNPIVLEKKNKIHNSQVSEYLKNAKLNSFREGTIILLEDLDNSIRTIIEDEYLNGDRHAEELSLIRSLRVLVTPLILSQSIQDELLKKGVLDEKRAVARPESTFEIFFGTNLWGASFEDQLIKIGQFSVLANYDYRVLGKVAKSGAVEGLYFCNRLPEDSFETTFQLSNLEVFSSETLRQRKTDKIDKDTITQQSVGNFFFDIRIYDRDAEALDKLSKILKTSGRRETGNVLDEFVGVRISKNGFGVKPYGEQEKDWMELGEMRVQNPSVILGMNQVIGNIFLFSPENDLLKEKTNREGFFENEAFITFKKILRSVLIEAGKRRFNYRQKHGIGRKATSKHDRPDATRFLEFIQTITKDPNKISEAQNYIEEIITSLDNLENSLSFSQRLAALGSGLELVYHEIAQPTSIVGKCLFAMKFSVGQVKDPELKAELLGEMSQIRAAIETLDRLKESLEPAIGRAKRKEFRPLDTFHKVCYLFTKDFLVNKITIEIDSKFENFFIKDFEYNLWVTFLNILNNAVYWIKTEDSDDRKIKLTLGSQNEIIISNTGPKIDSAELENIFNYGVTHKKVKNSTGLGLAFTRSLLSTHEWEIWAENKEFGPAFILKKK